MKSQISNLISEKSKYWWTSLVTGILSVILGIWCLATPSSTLIAITYVFVIGFFISGITDIVFAVFNRKSQTGWGWTLSGGIIDVVFGAILIATPLPIITTLMVFLIGFWLLFRSIWTIGIAMELRRHVSANWLLILSIISLLFSLLYLFSPAFGAAAIVVFASIAFLFYGIFRIFFGIKLKQINKRIQEFS